MIKTVCDMCRKEIITKDMYLVKIQHQPTAQVACFQSGDYKSDEKKHVCPECILYAFHDVRINKEFMCPHCRGDIRTGHCSDVICHSCGGNKAKCDCEA